ncbi:MAG: hypothetical protein H7Z75_20415 [Ferruginibacter sp.]|nr:hypothetical protein [Cytophagales bacterium]
MFPPFTRILIKIFASGFYRAHSGLLLSLFITVVIYFFFVGVLNQNHFTPDQIIVHNLKLVLTFVSDPIMTGIIFIVWLMYTVKSWQYIAGQLLVANQQFLFYSSTSFNRTKQFKSWFIVQLIVSLPIVGFGLFAVIIGIIFNYQVIPAVIPLYLLLLTSISAFLYVRLMNRLVDGDTQFYARQAVRNWPKPFFSLFLYRIFVNAKLTYGITKLISWLILIYIYDSFADVNGDLRVAGFVILGVVSAHAILIYQSHDFEKNDLSFSRNFPYSRIKLFVNFTGLYFLLLLPESLWLFTTFGLAVATELLLFGLSIALLFRSLLYGFGQSMGNYLRLVFGLFVLLYVMILFGLLWILIPVNLFVAGVVFYRNYYPSMDR